MEQYQEALKDQQKFIAILANKGLTQTKQQL
jgi:hypothetical protein